MLLVFWSLTQPLHAAFSLRAVRVFFRAGFINVSFQTEGMIPYKVIRALEDGVRIEYSYEFRLRRRVGFFLARDAVIAEKRVLYVLRYKFLTGRFQLEQPDAQIRMLLPGRSALVKELLQPFSRQLFPLALIESDKDYYLEARVVIRSTKLYPPFSFLSILSHEGDWVESGEFRR